MKRGSFAAVVGIFMSAVSAFALAGSSPDAKESGNVMINVGGHEVPVVAGGLYDRFRSNPPLATIESEAPGVDLSWFRGLKKTKVDIGFESYSPNFYYKNNRITAVYTADISKLRALIPAEVLEKVQPLQVWPGRGLVALTAYAYEYCDNDSYNEIALSIVTNKPGSSNLGPVSLVGQSRSGDFWGYVLKLPVNTELARVRGVVGYNLPKWLTGINRRESDKSVTFEIVDNETGKVDVVFEGEKLSAPSAEVELVTNSFTNIDKKGGLTYGYAVSRQLSHASSTRAESVNLTLNGGSLSTFMKSLDLGKMMKYEYVPQFQSALYAPESLQSMLDSE
ncbi:acetoacetate decarboxylase (ADC) [Pseudomonas taiwanensis]|uniref:acetoacetate decarboxylase (ADC) n=1 Tax=Pseudomonas taiwanensis TaxID=470150 RepID=UPI0015BF70F6|nr:acetoacetate decarboxylase (ADC) [Pseudomonas taiwanensis]